MERAPHRWTSLALTSGTLLAGACLLVGFVMHLLDLDAAASLSTIGVLVLMATPAAGLVATFFELRPSQPRVALLALAVLGVLGLAIAVALR